MTELSPSATPDELVYAAAIVILSNELYPRKLEVVREYIQNASDALDAFREVAAYIDDSTALQIKVSIQGRSLLIWDNGIGMDSEEIKKLRRVAYSEKRAGEEAGYKGIGRLAGIAVAAKLIISSTSYGDPELHKFEFSARAFKDDIASKKRDGLQEPASVVIMRHTAIETFAVDEREHYTMVELREIEVDYPELLDSAQLREYIAEIGPVGFSPDFTYGERLTRKLGEHVSDFSPKTVWLATATGDRAQVYKPYSDSMVMAEPEFIEIRDPANRQQLLAYCWYAARGKPMLGKIRPTGGKFIVDGSTVPERKRLAGLVYKLYGFSVGDRTLPLRSLWKKDYTRALWFTGEIHIVEKNILPTTDRSDFIDNDHRRRLYEEGAELIGKMLNRRAQDISNVRQAHDYAEKWRHAFQRIESQLADGGIERANLRAYKDDLRRAVEVDLRHRDCKDVDVKHFVDEVAKRGRALRVRLDEARVSKAKSGEISDLGRELGLTSHARKVYSIVMEVIEVYFRDQKDVYYELSSLITQALRRKY